MKTIFNIDLYDENPDKIEEYSGGSDSHDPMFG